MATNRPTTLKYVNELGNWTVTQETLALASMARDDSPASSTAAAAARRPMRGKMGSEFAT